jgi:phage-related protein
MISRYAVWLNDVSLAEVDPTIYVSDIGYNPSAPKFNSSRLGGRDGQYSGADYIEKNVITVSFEIHEYHTARRQEIAQDVANWASNGGWLKTSDRVSQKIYVKPTRFPAVSSVMRWTENLTVEFTAFDFPYWQDEEPQTVTLENGGTGELFVSGVRPTAAEMALTASANISSINVQVGASRLILSDLGAVSGDVITVSYTDEHHILEIKKNGASILNKRTAASNDDLIVAPGLNAVSFSADGGATCTISVRGVYL